MNLSGTTSISSSLYHNFYCCAAEDEKIIVNWVLNMVYCSVDVVVIFRVLNIKIRSKVVDQFIFIFCSNVKNTNSTVQTLILLPPQRNHFFIV